MNAHVVLQWALRIGISMSLLAIVTVFPGNEVNGRAGRFGLHAALLHGELIGVAHNNGDRKPYLMRSTDGAEFHAIAGPLTPGDRDPSLTVWYGKYWMAATQIASGHTFDVWYASDVSHDWTQIVVDAGEIGAVHFTWAPEWFLDPSQAEGLGQVHIFFAATTHGIDGPFRLYEMHPTSLGMTSWSTPVEVTGTGLPADLIDPFMVYAPEIGTPGKPYKLWYKDNDGAFIEYAESASLTSGYTAVESGNWANWKEGGSIEAICVVQLDDGGWRAYFNENAGLTTVGNFYSDSLDGWATWSGRANIATESLMSHGTYIRVASADDPLPVAGDRPYG